MLKNNDIKLATHIALQAATGKSNEIGDFLKKGASLVKQTEPNTKLWFALQENDKTFAIFDIFPNETARAEHFNGVVAAALRENAAVLIQGGWEGGVLSQVKNAQTLSSTVSANVDQAREATFIHFTANSGKAQALAELLTGAAQIIKETEPGTLFWTALQFDENHYGIFDVFSDSSARDAHFSGQVAAALNAQSTDLVKGGWDDGVVKNVHNYTILASTVA